MERKKESRNLLRLREDPRLIGDSWEYFRNWLNQLSPDTQEGYLREFNQFLEHRNQDTESFYDQYLGWVRDEDPRTKKKMGIEVTNYQKQVMQTRGVKSGSVINIYRAVKGFFTANELEFEINGEKVVDDSDQIPNISKDQLKQILGATGSYRIKAVTHFAKESGLRVGDITNITIGDVRPIWDDPTYTQVEGYQGFYQFDVIQGKTGNPAYPVIGPETVEALQLWKSEREDKGISDNDSDSLFCAVKNRKEWTTKAGIYHKGSNAGDTLDESTLGVLFGQYVRKAKIQPLRGEKRKPSIHSLRKYHKTNLEYGGCPTSWVNRLQGRKGEGTGGIYTKPNLDQLIDIYAKAYHTLSLKEESQVNGFKSELEDIKTDLRYTTEIGESYREDLQERDKTIEELKTQLANLTKLVTEKLNGVSP